MSDTDLNTVVNANDNLHFHWLELYTPEEQERHMNNIPLANYIIETHCPHWWKNNRQTYDYKSAQHWICGCIASAAISGPYTYHRMSWTLGCNPVVLMNDPKLKHIHPL
jgi:hypothetical protein